MTDFRDKELFIRPYELVDNHIDDYFKGSDITVFHEIPTLDIHLDVYHIKPEKSDFELLLSGGMSSIPTNVGGIARNSDSYKFAELMTVIPKGIDFGKMYPSGTKYDWIISMVKQSAKFPYFYDTWIGVGHTIQAHEEFKPYSDHTEYCGCLVLPTMTFPEDFQEIDSPNWTINIYGLFPLYKEELEFKIQRGLIWHAKDLLDKAIRQKDASKILYACLELRNCLEMVEFGMILASVEEEERAQLMVDAKPGQGINKVNDKLKSLKYKYQIFYKVVCETAGRLGNPFDFSRSASLKEKLSDYVNTHTRTPDELMFGSDYLKSASGIIQESIDFLEPASNKDKNSYTLQNLSIVTLNDEDKGIFDRWKNGIIKDESELREILKKQKDSADSNAR